MPNNEVEIISAELYSQGPRGKVGPKGDPAFIKFNIDANGNLIVDEVYENYIFVIVNGDLTVNWQ